MTAAQDILCRAQQCGMEIEVRGDKLKMKAPQRPPDDLVEAVWAHKPELLALLTSRIDDTFEERAAIVEYGAGVPREWAEGFARLDTARRPSGFSEAQWRQVLDDGGRFLDGGWAQKAAAIGWSATDIFGVHPLKPRDRFDAMGLVPLIRGGEIIDVQADRAVIQMPTGNNLTYYLRRHSIESITLTSFMAPPRRRCVSVRRRFQLPISVVGECYAKDDIVEARPASPDDDIAWWRILRACEIAAESSDFDQVERQRLF